jgi:hypothetical protein
MVGASRTEGALTAVMETPATEAMQASSETTAIA